MPLSHFKLRRLVAVAAIALVAVLAVVAFFRPGHSPEFQVFDPSYEFDSYSFGEGELVSKGRADDGQGHGYYLDPTRKLRVCFGNPNLAGLNQWLQAHGRNRITEDHFQEIKSSGYVLCFRFRRNPAVGSPPPKYPPPGDPSLDAEFIGTTGRTNRMGVYTSFFRPRPGWEDSVMTLGGPRTNYIGTVVNLYSPGSRHFVATCRLK
jgi:hypothetical protein